MDTITPLPQVAQPNPTPWRPRGCDNIALVLQGGGALGAYQAGTYQAMHEAGLWPDTVAGVSIGGINAAVTLRRSWGGQTTQRGRTQSVSDPTG